MPKLHKSPKVWLGSWFWITNYVSRNKYVRVQEN